MSGNPNRPSYGYTSSWPAAAAASGPTRHPRRGRGIIDCTKCIIQDVRRRACRTRSLPNGGQTHAAVASIVSPASAKESGADPVAKERASIPRVFSKRARGGRWPRQRARHGHALVHASSLPPPSLPSSGTPDSDDAREGGLNFPSAMGSVSHSTLALGRASRRIQVCSQTASRPRPADRPKFCLLICPSNRSHPAPRHMAVLQGLPANRRIWDQAVCGQGPVMSAPASPRTHQSLFSPPACVCAARRGWEAGATEQLFADGKRLRSTAWRQGRCLSIVSPAGVLLAATPPCP